MRHRLGLRVEHYTEVTDRRETAYCQAPTTSRAPSHGEMG